MTTRQATTPTRRRAGQRWRCLVASLLLLPAALGLAAEPPAAAPLPATGADETGVPFIRNFAPAEYGGSTQNWSVTEDHHGVIYIGNVDGGVFTFDGTRWRHIPIPNHVAVRSLATDAAGRIWVGLVGDLGYLTPDAQGRLHFVSLLDRIPPADREFTDVWKTLAAPDGVYFSTRAHTFRVAHDKVTVWTPRSAFHSAFLVRGRIYQRDVDRGLVRLTEHGSQLLPGGERFVGEKIYALLPWDGPGMGPDALLIGTRTQGWMVFDGHDYRPWSAEANAAIDGAMLYNAVWLRDGLIAAIAPPAGVLLFDRAGHLVRRIDQASGLANNEVNALQEDDQQGLWVTSDLGVSRIALDVPITQFDARRGLRGAVVAMAQHDGHLYAGTTAGLYRLDAAPGGGARFQPALQAAYEIWSFEQTSHGLLAGGMRGVLALDGDKPALAWATDQTAFSLMRSRRDPERVFVGLQNGLASIRWDGQRWRGEGRIEGIGDEVRTMQELADGSLWLGTWNGYVLHVRFPAGWSGAANSPGAKVQVRRYGPADGLPAGQSMAVSIDGQVRFATYGGIYQYDAGSDRFEPDPRFAHLFPDGPRQISVLEQDARGRLWMYTINDALGLKESGVATPDAQGRWHWSTTALRPLAGISMTTFRAGSDGTVWLAAEQQVIYRYAATATDTNATAFSTLLRKVSTRDGVLRAGVARDGNAPRIPYASNALRFEFAAPRFLDSEANRFQVRLEGLDGGWSTWSDEAYRDYTNLHEGDYRFRVRARDVYGTIGAEADFAFTVLPPWYRTWWAWLLWSATAMLTVALAIRWRLAAMRRRNRELAALVERRTAELKTANSALAEQTITDPLTGLRNRRYLHDHMQQDVAAARRQHQDRHGRAATPAHAGDLLFLMVDIDHFKEVNDTWGHAAGDRVLVQLCEILRGTVRETDTPVRWGGEEFLIVARFAQPDAGPQFAERIRTAVAGHAFDLGEGRILRRSCSIGFASYPFYGEAPDQLNWEQVVSIADECLYAAKRNGRNAWVGVAPMDDAPASETIEALHESLERLPEPGPLRLLTSWTPAPEAA